uniref:Uncharacterized protein n=1 Tax=Anguilla anguilla TaxID=7936 RepID=A0A0E9VBA6_ANGAN
MNCTSGGVNDGVMTCSALVGLSALCEASDTELNYPYCWASKANTNLPHPPGGD